MFKRLLKFALAVIISFLVVKLTTFGFKPSKKFVLQLSQEEEVTSRRLEDMVRHLSLEIGDRNYSRYRQLDKTADYIVGQFKALGYDIEVMTFTVNDQLFKNIIAQQPSAHKGESIIIGAHYDTCFNPGADDNASGVGGLIELARLLKDTKLSSNVKFVAFVNEEPPFFTTENMGSRVYARRAEASGETIKAAVVLEMLGYFKDTWSSQRYLPVIGLFYPNRANFIAVVGNFPSRTIVSKVTKGFKKGSTFPVESLVSPSFIPGVYFSDHWSFWKQGYPAVMVTDTAFLRNPHYHNAKDLPDTLDYGRMAKVVHGMKNAIIYLDAN